MSRTREGHPAPGLFAADHFAGFGPSRFRPPDLDPLLGGVVGKTQPRLLEGVKQHAPKLPGVYGMLDPRGRVIYIGKAKCLRVRVMSYFRKKSRDPKAARILRQTRALVWENTPDEFSALLRELELIRRFRPRFNVLGQPGPRRQTYLVIGKNPAPGVYLTREPTGKEVACYGPIFSRAQTEECVRRLNDWFQLRDCPSTQRIAFADQPALFPQDPTVGCMRHELGTCLGPCGGCCTRAEYSEAVRATKAFLDGRDRSALVELEARMREASGNLQFERALAIRDRLLALQWIDERLTFLRSARRSQSFVYPLVGADGTAVWYLIHRGEVRAAIREPQDEASRSVAAKLIEDVFADRLPAVRADDRYVDSVLLVAAWFRKRPGEKRTLLSRTAAARRCDEGRVHPVETSDPRKLPEKIPLTN